ncbi:hypothetical protein EDB81DRAFT_752833 [Dactylonectria macrodidyma]|uniref:Uncharacterized protein n=1 Tax=Dactylonectria macrodidyma TaxID=307937 RepID=A0A9P9JP09_9HYPO|nr:hypothetical protein EDB81DRAFT_752833 [Dactylonectria macrodidyma]
MSIQRRAAAIPADAGDEAPAPSATELSPLGRPSPARRSALPVAVQFPLVTVLSFSMASLGYSLLGEVTKGELAAVSRSQDTWEEVGLLAAWRGIELALGWFGKLDSLDVAMLDLLSHGPHFYLLSTFYKLSASTALSALLIDMISVAAPFYLLRPLSAVHTPSAAAKLPNRELLDVALQLYTAALSTGIYSVILVLSLRFILPSILVVYFAGLPTIEPAYAASYTTVLPVTLMFGIAASTFIFAPFATTGHVKEDDKVAEFDPVEASLGETVWWNAWGYTAKTKVVIRRTAVAVLVSAINTFLASSKTVYGVEPLGAAAYSGVWALAALCTGVALGFVGSE